MGVFSSGGVGIDLGSANVTIFLESEGVVLREPSYVLASRDDPDNVLACGRDARQMLGRTPRAAMLVSPVMDGAVGDIEMTTTLLRELSEKAIGRRRALDRTRVVVSMGLGVTRVERAALEEAVKALDARRAALVRSTVAAAVGAGVSIDEPKGVMVVNIGGSTTEVAVLSADGVAASRSVRTGGMALDEAIIRYIRNEKGLVIGQRTAEDLKIDIGSAGKQEPGSAEDVLLRGRDVRTGKPATVSVSPKDVNKAILPPLQTLLENIREAFENTPPELAADILERGVYLSGGGARLEGLRERLSELLSMPVHMSGSPEDDVAAGAGAIAADERLAFRLRKSGCLIEL